MTEATVKGDLVPMIKTINPGFVVLRIEDLFTKGIPDIVSTGAGLGSWIEVKLLKKGDTVTKCVTGKNTLQYYTMRQLHRTNGGRAWYVFYDMRKPKAKQTIIVEPEWVLKTPLAISDSFRGRISSALETEHCCVWPGFAHRIVAQLVADAHVV
jgi:hypothetical protein